MASSKKEAESKLGSGPYKKLAKVFLTVLKERKIYEPLGSGNMPAEGKLTIREFAEKHDLGSQNIWGILWGRNVPRKSWILKFSKACKLPDEDIDYLLLLSEAERDADNKLVAKRFLRYAEIVAPAAVAKYK